MTAEQWVRSTYTIVDGPFGDAIDWGNGTYTPISNFLSLFGTIIDIALTNNRDPKQDICDSDPNNEKGFNDLL